MFKHYLTSALRHFARHKTVTTINVACLAFGLISFALAYGTVRYFSYSDTNNEKADRTFVLTQRNEFVNANTSVATQPISGPAIGPLLRAEYPNLEIVARAIRGGEVAVAAGSNRRFANAAYADAEFLDVIALNFIAGDSRRALNTPRSAVISEGLAAQLFGRTDVVGQTLLLMNRETVRITGVVAEQRQPSHISTSETFAALQFSLLFSMDTRDALLPSLNPETTQTRLQYFGGGTFTYVVFPASGAITPDELRGSLRRFSEKHIPSAFGRATFGIRPVSEIYAAGMDFFLKSDVTGVRSSLVILLIGAMVLIVSCLNYANLASAQATTRLKEIALRRVVGAGRKQIIAQSFAEALVVALIAAALAVAVLPVISNAMQVRIGFDIGSAAFASVPFWLVIAATVVAVALLASSYPALIAARVRPASALQSGKMRVTKRYAMQLLVVCQFAASSILFVASTSMNAQNEKLRSNPFGASGDPIVTIGNDLKDAGVDATLLRNELQSHSSVISVSANNARLGGAEGPAWIVRGGVEPASRSWIIRSTIVDYDFIGTMGIRLLAGRDFDRTIATDLSTGRWGDVVIDRSLALDYGWSNPQDAIGKSIFFATNAKKDVPGMPVTVIGVVENAKLYPITMLGSASSAYLLDPSRAVLPIIRLSRNEVQAGLSAIDATWNRLAPNVQLKRKFLDDEYEALYRQFTSMTISFRALAILSMLIGTMGLIGIATHAIAQRRFEIGIRRTLGASTPQMLVMLLKDFSKPILVANLIAWPFAFVIAKAYSSLFADKLPLTIAPFAGSLLLGLAIAWLAVLKQVTSAARMNPATVLRHE